MTTKRPSATRAAERILESRDGSETTVELLVVSDSDERVVGLRVLGRSRGVEGSLGDRELDELAAEICTRERAEPSSAGGVHVLETASGRRLEVYVECHRPRQELIIVGAGHIAQPLSVVGTLLGFEVTVLDDRPEFATRERFPEATEVQIADFGDPLAGVEIHGGSHIVLVTRGHKYDYECLRRLLADDVEPAYVGMIGSRRRVRATYVQLDAEGIPPERIERVRAPVGLDIGAETPAEIAVSVVAEMILERRGGRGLPLRDLERIVERFVDPGGADRTEPEERSET